MWPISKVYEGILNRHPEISRRISEKVDRDRINMASKKTITNYFNLLLETLVKNEIIELDEKGNPLPDAMIKGTIYLADETGWGADTKKKLL